MHLSLQNMNQPRTVFYQLKSNFGKIICKLREYLMIFCYLAQDPMGIISGLLTRGCKDHFEC